VVVYEYSCAVTWHGLKLMAERDAERENDGDAIISQWRLDMIPFWNNNHNKLYKNCKKKFKLIQYNYLPFIYYILKKNEQNYLTSTQYSTVNHSTIQNQNYCTFDCHFVYLDMIPFWNNNHNKYRTSY
jgi:imidazoleglycerol phosphate synthase glutamine amidotransferase subunit HisH